LSDAKVLRTPQHPGTLIINDKHRDRVQSVSTRSCTAHELLHNVPATRIWQIARFIRKFGEYITCDTTGSECKCTLFLFRERLWCLFTLICQRSAVQFHSRCESS